MSGGAEALVLARPRHFERRAFSLPAVGDHAGLLRIEACGLCGTDHEQYPGHLAPGYGFVPGHEAVGVVEEAGAAALERWGVAIGDRVAVEVFQRPTVSLAHIVHQNVELLQAGEALPEPGDVSKL